MTPDKSDFEVANGYLAGDPKANRLIETYIEVAFRSWRDRFGYQTDDILSDVRYKLLMSLRGNDFAYRSSLKAFISGIVRHTCLDYYRANKRWQLVDIDEQPQIDESLSPEDQLQKRETGFLHFRVIRLLPKECLKLWQMQLKEGLKCREIGERLGKSEVNIRGKLLNCRRKAMEIREKLLNNHNISDSETP